MCDMCPSGGYAEEGGYADVGDYPCAFQGDLDDDDQWAEGLDPPIDDQPVAPVPGDDALGRGGRWTGEERASTKDSTGGKGESGGGLEDDFDYLCFLDDAPATDRGHQEAEHEEAPYVDNQGSTNRAPSRHLVPPLPTSPPVPSPSSALLSPEHRSPSPLHIATSPPQPSDLAPLPLSSPKGHLAPLSPPSDLSSPLGEGPTALFVSPRSSPKSSLVSASPRVRASLPSSTPRATTVVGSPVVPPHFGSVPSLSSSKDLNKVHTNTLDTVTRLHDSLDLYIPSLKIRAASMSTHDCGLGLSSGLTLFLCLCVSLCVSVMCPCSHCAALVPVAGVRSSPCPPP